MKTIFAAVLSAILMPFFCQPSYATECTTDIDCNMYNSERCITPAYSNRGECVSVNKILKERKPDSSIAPPSSAPPSPAKRGKFCMTNSDCDPGQSCVKKGNDDVYGSCF
jgi:hypothetical protein